MIKNDNKQQIVEEERTCFWLTMYIIYLFTTTDWVY